MARLKISFWVRKSAWLVAGVCILGIGFTLYLYDSRVLYGAHMQKIGDLIHTPAAMGRRFIDAAGEMVMGNATFFAISDNSFLDVLELTRSTTPIQPINLTAQIVNNSLNFIIPNSQYCLMHQPHVLIWVHSAPGYFDRRRAVRNTWGNSSLYRPIKVRVVFSLAVTEDSVTQKLIEKEHEHYGDIIQDGSFIDSYSNLTLKSQGMLKWSNAYCKNIELLFKVDDDTFLVPRRFRKWLKRYWDDNSWPRNAILGTRWYNQKPNRNMKSRWGISEEDWPRPIFSPVACPGSGYFISGDALPKMVAAIAKAPFLWIEDMYTTGVLAEIAHLEYKENIRRLLFTKKSGLTENIKWYTSVFLAGNMPNVSYTYQFWNKVKSLS